MTEKVEKTENWLVFETDTNGVKLPDQGALYSCHGKALALEFVRGLNIRTILELAPEEVPEVGAEPPTGEADAAH